MMSVLPTVLRWLALAGFFLGATEALAAGPAPDLKDDRGLAIAFAVPPQRIVSLLPSLTEAVCELGGCGRLVGVDRYSNFPASLRDLPKLGGIEDANVEQIVALKPDVVLLAYSSRVAARLESLGLKVLMLEPRTLADMERVFARLEELLAVKERGAAWRRLQAAIEGTAAALSTGARGLRVYFELDSSPFAASESSYIGELLQRLGVRNVVPGALGQFPKLNPEFVVRADPQVIMVVGRGGADPGVRPGWQRIRAVRDGYVCRYDDEETNVLMRPGPRVVEAVQLMVRCLRRAATGAAGSARP
jgi:iron complex transport system substrate-binding protein